MSGAYKGQPTTNNAPPTRLRELFTDALRYWEPRRIIYNLVLTVATSAWLIVLALIANVCYCMAYLADVFLQLSSFQLAWRRWRWALWLSGMLFALLVANYWTADEIYPYVR
jgi:hypothetical protein